MFRLFRPQLNQFCKQTFQRPYPSSNLIEMQHGCVNSSISCQTCQHIDHNLVYVCRKHIIPGGEREEKAESRSKHLRHYPTEIQTTTSFANFVVIKTSPLESPLRTVTNCLPSLSFFWSECFPISAFPACSSSF